MSSWYAIFGGLLPLVISLCLNPARRGMPRLWRKRAPKPKAGTLAARGGDNHLDSSISRVRHPSLRSPRNGRSQKCGRADLMGLKIRQGAESTDQKNSKEGRVAPPLVAGYAHANNDLDAANLGSIWWRWDPTHRDIVARDVVQRTARFTEEMMVVVNVRIEIRTPGINDDLAQETGRSKLIKNIVDGC